MTKERGLNLLMQDYLRKSFWLGKMGVFYDI